MFEFLYLSPCLKHLNFSEYLLVNFFTIVHQIYQIWWWWWQCSPLGPVLPMTLNFFFKCHRTRSWHMKWAQVICQVLPVHRNNMTKLPSSGFEPVTYSSEADALPLDHTASAVWSRGIRYSCSTIISFFDHCVYKKMHESNQHIPSFCIISVISIT